MSLHYASADRHARPVVTIKLASTSDELLQCFALRSAVYIGEQQCPYWEEFDGNDFTATHLILYVDGEPASSMRLRWFGTFAKFERAVILKRYRSMGLFIPFTQWAMEFAARRATASVYLHSQHRLWPIMRTPGLPQGRRQGLQLLRPRIRRLLPRPRRRREEPPDHVTPIRWC